MLKKIYLPLLLFLVILLIYLRPEFQEITAGVAILLFGMISLEAGFNSLTEGPLRKLLAHSTDKFYKSFALGLVTTAVLQSSSLISVITISFIAAGLINLRGGIGIIFGANLGTTATSWLVATLGLKVNISALAMPMLIIGIILILQKKKSLKGLGNVLAGMGFLFLGIHYMKGGFESFKDTIDLAQYSMEGIGGMMLYAGMGIMMTVILQSSSATMSIIITALAASQISYFNALSLAVGANVGTTITAVIGASASNPTGRQLAGAHLIFNLGTGIVAMALLLPLSWSVDMFSKWVEIAPDNYTLKLALFHTIFNLLGVLIMYPFVRPMSRLLVRVFPVHKQAVDEAIYITESAMNYPQTAVAALINETHHLVQNSIHIFTRGLGYSEKEIVTSKSLTELEKDYQHVVITDVERLYHEKVKNIYGKIIEFATRAQAINPDQGQIDLIYRIKEANRNVVEAIKELKEIQPNLSKYLNSNHIEVRSEYAKLRYRIGKILHQVFKARWPEIPKDSGEQERHEIVIRHVEKRLKKLGKHRALIKEYDIQFNSTLESLIKERKINSEEASSLLNDSTQVKSICKNLIRAAELLYMEPDVFHLDRHHQPENEATKEGNS